MWCFALLLGLLSLTLSAIFSGSEIGFYRVPRTRLKLAAMQGHLRDRGLLWLANRPSFFVATVLVGNNTVNYLFSLSVVLFVQSLFGSFQGILIELFSTLMLAPVLFVYGEMFPKYLFLHAPGRLLRKVAPLLFFFAILLLPITIFLWLFNRLAALILRQPHEIVRLTLARAELEKTLDEGHEAGLLRNVQRRLADNVFAVASEKVRDMAEPLGRYPFVTGDTKASTVLTLARALRLNEIPVFDPSDAMTGLLAVRPHTLPIGYIRTIDLELRIRHNREQAAATALPIRDLAEIPGHYSPLTALNLFQTAGESFGLVLDQNKNCLGLITSERLRDLLL